MNKLIYALTFLSLLHPSFVHSEDMNLIADNRVEWHHKKQQIVAIGNAVATRGDMQVKADKMSANYKRNSTTNKNQITQVHASGNVKMKSERADAYGNTLDYNLEKDIVILRGKPAKIKTATETITADDNITYYPQQQKAIALGNVKANNNKDQIFGDKMIAFFEQSSNNSQNMELKQVEIYGNVKIVNGETTVWADRGIYNPQTALVKLYDNIIIEQNGNRLQGDYAQSDLNKGISKILSGKTSKQRVTGVFKEKKQNKQSSTTEK